MGCVTARSLGEYRCYATKETPMPDPLFSEDDIIYSYPRAQAIQDGTLSDVTPIAAEAGFLSAGRAYAYGVGIPGGVG